jgi:flagellin-like protein
MKIEWLNGDVRGVTPVIGTILVVAVVVVLAAAIGATTLGFTEDINEPPAKAVLDLNFKEADAEEPDWEKFLWRLELTHNGGDNVNGEDIIVYLNHGDVRLTGEYNGTLSSGETAEVAIVHTNGYEDTDKYDCDDNNVACSLAGDVSEGHFPDEDHVDLLMIHEPSDTILYEEEIEISGNYGIYNDEEERSDDELTFK